MKGNSLNLPTDSGWPGSSLDLEASYQAACADMRIRQAGYHHGSPR
jgi:hypothetical protein